MFYTEDWHFPSQTRWPNAEKQTQGDGITVDLLLKGKRVNDEITFSPP